MNRQTKCESESSIKRILIADDEKNLLELFKYSLEKEFIINLAKDGNEALEILEKHWIDLIILDLNMPGLDGISLLKILRQQFNYHLPVIIITAHSSKEKAEEAANYGVSGYILKPFNIDYVISKIRLVLAYEDMRPFHRIISIARTEIDKLSPVVEMAMGYIQTHYSRKKLTLEEIADSVYISKSYLSHLFKRECNLSPKEYLTSLKLEAAKRLLESGRKLSEISDIVGFHDDQHLSRVFRRKLNITPSGYRNSAKNDAKK